MLRCFVFVVNKDVTWRLKTSLSSSLDKEMSLGIRGVNIRQHGIVSYLKQKSGIITRDHSVHC